MAVVASLVLTTLTARAQGPVDNCFVVADKGNFPDDMDLLTRITPERGTSVPVTETTIGFTGSLGIEALAADEADPSFTLWAADKNRLGTIDKVSGAFMPKPMTFGSGTGAEGTKTFGNVDSLAFHNGRLYATHRSEEEPDLLFRVDPATGQRIPDAFGSGIDYRVVPSPGGRHNVDAMDSGGGVLYAILNERGGDNSILVRLDPDTAVVNIIGPTTLADDVEGFTIGQTGAWYINGRHFDGTRKTYVWEADLTTGAGSNPRPIGLTNGARDYEGIQCQPGTPGPTVLKFEDRDGDGQRFLGAPGVAPEPFLAGWEIHFIGAAGTHFHGVTTLTGVQEIQDAGGGPLIPLGSIPPDRYLVCESLQTGWTQTAPPAPAADCTGHTHAGSVEPGPRGFDVDLPGDPNNPPNLEFGNRKGCINGKQSSNARAYGIRADLLGGGLLPADPDIGPTPDSNVTNPDQLLSVPNFLDPTSPPLVSLLSVSEQETPSDATATATTAAVDLNIPALGFLRIQADGVVAKSRSFAGTGGATSSSAGSTIVNLRIGGVQYGDVSEPLTVEIKDPLNPGTPFVEIHVLERIRRDAAAGIIQPVPPMPAPGSLSKSGLDVNGIHVVVHDLSWTTFLDESSDIVVAHASTDIAFKPNFNCPSVSGRAFAAQLSNVIPNLGNGIVGEVVLPSTGGGEAKNLADVDVGTLLTADAASTSTNGSVTFDPDTASASSKAVITNADLSGLLTAKLVEVTANASCVSPPASPTSCPSATPTGTTTIADVDVLGTIDVCATLGLTTPCQPPVDYVFLDIPGVIKVVFNEQKLDPDGRGITVNGIHIWLLGAIPGSGLPVGAEVIISSAHADTHKRLP